MENIDKQKEQIMRDLLYEGGISNPRLYELFAIEEIINVAKKEMEHIQATEFMLMKVEEEDIGGVFEIKFPREMRKEVNFDEHITKMYSSSIINGQVGELDILEFLYPLDLNFILIDYLSGLNRDDLSNYDLSNHYKFFYKPKIEELKEREFIILVIIDRIPNCYDRILYFAPIEYPKDSNLTITKLIENYIYDTFCSVSEVTKRRYITFLQRYCSEDKNRYKIMRKEY